MLWECKDCGALFSVGAEQCPQCRSNKIDKKESVGTPQEHAVLTESPDEPSEKGDDNAEDNEAGRTKPRGTRKRGGDAHS